MDHDHQERIRQRAHEIWENEGRPEGRDADHWTQAEQELREQSAENPAGEQAQPAAEAMAPKARKPRKPAAKSAAGGKAAQADTASYLSDGP